MAGLTGVSAILLVLALVAAFIAKISARRQIQKMQRMQEELDAVKKKMEDFNKFKNDFLTLFCPDVDSLLINLNKHLSSLSNTGLTDQQKKLTLFLNSINDKLSLILSNIMHLPQIDNDTAMMKSLRERISSKPWYKQ